MGQSANEARGAIRARSSGLDGSDARLLSAGVVARRRRAVTPDSCRPVLSHAVAHLRWPHLPCRRLAWRYPRAFSTVGAPGRAFRQLHNLNMRGYVARGFPTPPIGNSVLGSHVGFEAARMFRTERRAPSCASRILRLVIGPWSSQQVQVREPNACSSCRPRAVCIGTSPAGRTEQIEPTFLA